MSDVKTPVNLYCYSFPVSQNSSRMNVQRCDDDTINHNGELYQDNNQERRKTKERRMIREKKGGRRERKMEAILFRGVGVESRRGNKAGREGREHSSFSSPPPSAERR